MSEERKFFSGETVEQAVLQAARHYRVEPEELAYRQLEKRYGFLKTRRRVMIEVDPEAPARGGKRAEAPEAGPERVASPPPRSEYEPQRVAEPAEPEEPAETEAPAEREVSAVETVEVSAEKLFSPFEEYGGEASRESGGEAAEPPAQPAEDKSTAARKEGGLVELPEGPRGARERFSKAEGSFADAAREALDMLFELSSLELEAEVLQGEEALEIELWGADQETLLRDRGRLLLAIQHLLPRLIRGIAGDSVPCRVDCDHFHEIRAERLRHLAQKVASEVQQGGRPRTLEPMSPDERRIVHLTLADDPTVETESKGQGLFKRVMVRPLRRGRRGFDSFR